MHKTFGTIIFNTVETFQLEHLILFLVFVFVLFGKKIGKDPCMRTHGKKLFKQNLVEYGNSLNMKIGWSIFLRIIHEFQSAIRISSNQFYQFDRYEIFKKKFKFSNSKLSINDRIQIVCVFVYHKNEIDLK